MEEKLLEYFDTLEDYFINYSSLDVKKIEELIIRLRKKRIKLGSQYDKTDPYSLFNCLYSNLGYACTFDKDDNLIKKIDYKESLYELLEEYGYYYNNDIKLALQKFQKSSLKNKYYFADDFIYKGSSGYKNIQNFELDGQYIYITDASHYTYTIIDLNNYDIETDKFNISRISHVIANGGKNDCHNYASQISQLLPEGETITSACPRFMRDSYYLHSYTQYGDYIIDLTLNIMMSKEDYYRLMSPFELSRTKNTDILEKKQEIESKIGDLENLGKQSWSYILYIAFLNIMNNPQILDSFNQNISLSKKKK